MICSEARRIASFIEEGWAVYVRSTTVAERGAMRRHIHSCKDCQSWVQEQVDRDKEDSIRNPSPEILQQVFERVWLDSQDPEF